MTTKQTAWSLDQLSKSVFFHQKLHEWQLVAVANQIEQFKGETLTWNIDELAISAKAWQKVIHGGIKPVIVFAHPTVLQTVALSTGYYRMLAMVSQKSMAQVGLSTQRYEEGITPDEAKAQLIAVHLNKIMTVLIEIDEQLDSREFDLWRGMAAGSQAQGSWQNSKGDKAELVVKEMIQRRLHEKALIFATTEAPFTIQTTDGRSIIFSDEPDVAIYQHHKIVMAMEVKGGIDKAAVLERVGATIKSLARAKEENPAAITILILQGVSMTAQSKHDLQLNQPAVNYWFTIEEILQNEQIQTQLFTLLNI